MGKPTELMQLLKTGNSDAARKLIAKMKKSGKKKALAKELNIPDESGSGQTVIHYCASQNFVEFLHDLADLGATIDIVDGRGLTPLHLAALSGRTSAVSALLGRGADANVASPNGDTPLHFACQGGHTATVEALIAEHANCTMLNVSGHTPLDMACQNGHANVVGALLRSGQFPQSFLQRSDMPHTAILLAAKSGHNEVIGILIKHGFDINRKLPGANGNCLHEAALYGKVETVKFLLQCGADITSVNNQGHSALDIVNMYTDPRSAGQMKQVLQDALAQHARAKIAQQHQQQQLQQLHHQQQQQHQYHHAQQGHQGHQGHHAQQQGHSYQRQPPRDGQYQQHHPSSHSQQPPPQRQGAPTQPSAAPGQSSPSRMHQGGGFSYLMPGAGKPPSPRMQAGGQHRQQQQQQHHQQPPISSAAQQQQYHHHQQQPGQQQHQHMEQKPRAGAYPTAQSLPGQGYQHQHQQHQQQPQHQLQGAAYQQQRQEQMRQYQIHSQQSASSAYQQQRQNSFPQQQQPPPPTSTSGGYQHQQSFPGQQPQQHYQQQQQQQGATHTPDASRRSGGAVMSGPPSDLAAMIAAKAASRKPMTTSPTRKDFPTSSGGPMEHDARLIRSSTMGRDGSISDARHSALRRRNSLTDQHSSTSPEPYDHSNPPTLPRRTNIGPPQFKPPPPSEGTLPPQPPSSTHQNRLSNVSNRSDEGAIDVEPERPKLRKIQPKPPPQEPSMDNELLKKLQRRQNRIQKAEEEGVESLDPHLNPRELQDEEPSPKHEAAAITVATEQAAATPPVQQKLKTSTGGPPPIPQRKTATLTTQPSVSSSEPPPPPPPSQPPPPSSQPPPTSTQPAAVTPAPAEVNKVPPPKAKPKAKPPPPKPKEEEPGLSPWQAELQKRKQKRAEEAEVAAQSMMTEQQPEKMEEEKEKVEPTAALEKKQQTPPPGPPPVVSKKPPKPTPAGRERASSDAPPPAPPTQPPPPPVTQAPPPEPVVAPPTPEPVAPPPPVDKSAEEVKLKPETTPTAPPNSTPSGESQLSRSTSLSSLATGSTAPMLPVTEPIAIGDWLSNYKLGDYTHLFEASGYDRTDFLLSITSDELVEIGVQKPGHKKKIMSAVSSLIHKEHLIATKPASVPEWLILLNLTQYEQVLMDAGYDDIDFVSDITTEELQDIGITKKGHLKRFMRGIAELLEVSPATPTAADAPIVQNGKEQVDLAAELTKALPPSDLKMPSPEADFLPPPPPPPASSYAPQPEENGLKDAVSVESIEAPPPKAKPKPASRSPSHSPQTQRRVIQPPPPSSGGAAPPPPRRAPQTALSAAPDSLGAQNRYSYSSSTSSLSSGYSERVAGSVDIPLATQQQQQVSAAAVGVAESPPGVPPKKNKPSPSRRTKAPERVPLRDEPEMPPPGAPLSPKKKTYSVEDITAALDEIIVQDEYLRDNGTGDDENILPPPIEYGEDVGVSVGGAPNKSAREAADEGLDALSKALQGFSVEGGGGPGEDVGEPDQLLADIDDMLADLNTHLDFMIPEGGGGTDV